MSSSFRYMVVGSFLLTACAHAPQQPVSVPAVQVEVAPPLPNIELSEELLYEYLLTEIASQRGHQELAVEGSADLVRKTRDPRLARRAAQLAVSSGQIARAIDALREWQELEPDAVAAGHMLSSLLLRSGRLDEAKALLVEQLKASEPNQGGYFTQVFQLVVPYSDKAAALKLIRELAQPYPQLPEARWAVAYLAHRAGDAELALAETREAHSLRPEWGQPVLLEAQLLMKAEPQQGLNVLRRYLSSYPESDEVRLQYARALLEQKEYKLARAEFQRLDKEDSANPEMAFAVALISLQLKDYEGAEEQLRRALSRNSKDQDRVQYYLGQLSEAKEDADEAMGHYREVKDGEHRFAAQLRVVYLLNQRSGLDAAREHLHQIRADDIKQRVGLLLVDVQLLRDAKQLEEGYQVLQQGLESMPNHPDLLYEAAMLADKIGKYKKSEQLLRKLIELQPDHAHARNALGYSLLERNERVVEALALVEKALQLAPDDIAIMDSVGWGYYRNGRLNESVNMLRRAFAGNPDPEIAAHLGEVLWVRGDKEEARSLLRDSLKSHPDSVQLQALIKKFIAQ